MKRLLFVSGCCLLVLFLLGNRTTAQETVPTNEIYLPIFFAPGLQPPYDMVQFMVGDGRLYEVEHSSGSQARHQTQTDPDGRFYHTKGNEVRAEWEELWYSDDYIWRGTDTSPGNGEYYTLRDNSRTRSAWAPRFWDVGDIFERNPYVTFYRKSDCAIVRSDFQPSWLRFEAFYNSYTFESGITLKNVVELTWLLNPNGEPIESYFYAQHFGLAGWGSDDRGVSHVSEVHAPGQRPDNKREEIPCIAQSIRVLPPEEKGN